jgi:hypothetical protein
MNDPRMVSTRRKFEIDGDTLGCEMKKSTTEADRLRRHLAIEIGRVRA